MTLDGSIANTAAERTFLGIVAVFLVLLMIRYWIFPKVKMGKGPLGMEFGGPWTVLNREFWRERDFHPPPGMRRWGWAGLVFFGAIYIVLDVVF